MVKSLLTCVVAAVLAASGVPARAAVLSWSGAAGDGVYHTAGNWSPVAVPGLADTARFAGGQRPAVTVNVSFADTGGMLVEGAAAVTLTLEAPLSLVSSTGNSLEVRGNAALTLGGGYFDSKRTVIGSEGSAGTVNVGEGAQWLLRGDLYVGGAPRPNNGDTPGVGSLNIANGSVRFYSPYSAVVVGGTAGSRGDVNVGTGGGFYVPGILDVAVGGGSGRLIVDGGGQAQSFAAYLGSAGSPASAMVSGVGSIWRTGPLTMQGSSLSIAAGGEVVSSSAKVGTTLRSTVDVSGTGSTWTVEGLLSLDEPFLPSTGSALAVSDGGRVRAGGLRVGQTCSTPGCTPTAGSVFLRTGGELTVMGQLDVNQLGANTPNGLFIEGGKLALARAGDAVHGAAGIEWRSGTLKLFEGGVDIGASRLLPTATALQAHQQLSVTGGALTVSAGRSLTLGDGSVSVGRQEAAAGTGQLAVTDGTLQVSGGTLSSTLAVIGSGRTSATVTVDGLGASWVNMGSVSLGSALLPGQTGGQALLSIGAGASVDAGGRLSIADTGHVRLASEGQLAARVIVNDGGVIEGDGRLVGQLQNRGEFAGLLPGYAGIGTLTVDGSLAFTDGLLGIEIGGLSDGLHDLLAVHGDAAFSGGRILLHLQDGYLPEAGDVVPFLLSDSVSDFRDMSLLITGGRGDFEIREIDGGRGLAFVALSRFVSEPGDSVLVAIALAALGASRRGRQRV